MKIAIAYASLSGNTTAVAREIERHFLGENHQVAMFSLLDTKADTLKIYDLVVMGSSTYGEGLNPIAELFFDFARVSGHACEGTRFAVFALGDSTYPEFATSGKLMREKLGEFGACVVGEILIIDGKPAERQMEEVRGWAEGIVQTIC